MIVRETTQLENVLEPFLHWQAGIVEQVQPWIIEIDDDFAHELIS